MVRRLKPYPFAISDLHIIAIFLWSIHRFAALIDDKAALPWCNRTKRVGRDSPCSSTLLPWVFTRAEARPTYIRIFINPINGK
jgi:hypothetical protein